MKDYGRILADLKKEGRLRTLKPLSGRKGCTVQYRSRKMLNLTSNDYLGLAADLSLYQRFYARMADDNLLDDYGLGSASSRLLTGDSKRHHDLESLLAATYGAEAALLFNSGYHANIGILPALLGKGDLILSDKLNHASIHDGLRLSAADHKRFRHGDYAHLEDLLTIFRSQYEQVIIVSESVFSMDGDVADLRRLAKLKNRFDCLLYIDEAHAAGLYGAQGLGQAEEQDVLGDIDLLVGTFGKALASVGAYVICSGEIREYLVNHSRSLIFTTALPPVTISWNLFVFELILAMDEKRRHLTDLGQKLRCGLRDCGLPTDGSTNIIPVVIGDNSKALSAAAQLQEMGYLIFPVRPPAVPEGTARFRISLTAGMKWEDICDLPRDIASCLSYTG
jgi:8-amino-7-oxononanoate synthase